MAAAPADGIQDHYMSTLNMNTSEHLEIYNKPIFGLPENDRYDLIRSKLTYFYQELENAVSKFELKAAVKIVVARDLNHAPTELKKTISSYL